MPSTYAAYWNLVEAEKHSGSTCRASAESERSNTSSSSSKGFKTSLKRVLEHLKPTEEPLTPADIYSPIIKQGHLFGRKSSSNPTKA
jgi:hypothetical protein